MKIGITFSSILDKLYILSVFALFALQFIFVLHAQSQIRYEELAESVRNVFFLQHRLVYDGVSSNVGWYATLLFIYHVFGFQLHTSLYFKSALDFIALFCTALILKKYLGSLMSLLPLWTIGLSPTVLYFNTLQTSYGSDILYLPICLFLIIFLNCKRLWFGFLETVFLWTIAMVAWLSYPTFIFYIPVLAILYSWKIKETRLFKKPHLLSRIVLVSVCAFVSPALLIFIYIKNNSLLIYDPVTKGGLFRGAGTFNLNSVNFFNTLAGISADLFYKGQSYYFELYKGEFSDFYPILPIIVILLVSIIISLRHKRIKKYIVVVWIVLLVSLLFVALTYDPSGKPGIRRATFVISVFYVLFVFVWNYFLQGRLNFLKWGGIGVCILILIHHLLVYPINLKHLSDPSPARYTEWFTLSKTPAKSLDLVVSKAVHDDLNLGCFNKARVPLPCRYTEIFAAVKGYCVWNNLDCYNIYGFDIKTNKFIPLNVDLWTTYYFGH